MTPFPKELPSEHWQVVSITLSIGFGVRLFNVEQLWGRCGIGAKTVFDEFVQRSMGSF